MYRVEFLITNVDPRGEELSDFTSDDDHALYLGEGETFLHALTQAMLDMELSVVDHMVKLIVDIAVIGAKAYGMMATSAKQVSYTEYVSSRFFWVKCTIYQYETPKVKEQHRILEV